MDLDDVADGRPLGERHLDQVVEAPGSDEGRLDPVRPARGRENEETGNGAQPVQELAETDEERRGRLAGPLGRHHVVEGEGMGVLEEDDPLPLGGGELADFADHLGRPRPHLRGERRHAEVVEEGVRLHGEGLGQQGLAVARGPVEEPAARRIDPPLSVELGAPEGVGEARERRFRRLVPPDHVEGHGRPRHDLHAAPELPVLLLELPEEVLEPALDRPLHGRQG